MVVKRDVEITLTPVRSMGEWFGRLKGMHRGFKKEHECNLPVDLLCYTAREFEQKRKEASIVRDAVKKGVEI